MKPAIRYGMIGGGKGAFIGNVHRMAARLDGRFELIAGCLSSTPQRARESGREIGLPDDRNYPTWRAMLDGERALPAQRRIQAVSIVTPNDGHFEIASAFADAGFNIILDKPMVQTSEQARALARVAAERGVVLCITYNYTGYPMVRAAREMVRAGEIGTIRKVIVEYHQGWLASPIESSGHKQASWRTDPARAGLGGAIGDIGTHAENLLSHVTGLRIEAVCADLSTFIPGRQLDDDAAVLLRLEGGARGVLSVSQVCAGSENDLRLRIWGERGGLEWRQEDPNVLSHTPDGQPARVLRRGNTYAPSAAAAMTRLPSGHPEAFIEAFANIYAAAASAIETRESAGVSPPSDTSVEFPGIIDGVRGVAFIEAVVASSRAGGAWTALPPQKLS